MSQSLRKYASFIKVEHSLFSVPMLFAGALLAEKKWPSPRIVALIIIAGISARVMAMTLNRIIDRDIDSRNPRTQSRHIPRGEIKLGEAWGVVGLSGLVYVYTAWNISDLCLLLSWIPVAAFAAYPLFKRFTKWTHLFLGTIWAMVPLAGFIAVNPSWAGLGPVIFLAAFSTFWLAGFDIIYAVLDEESDRENNVHSLPAAWGRERALKMSGFLHLLAFLSLCVLYGVWFEGPITVMLLFIVGVLLFLEHQFVQYIDFAFFYMNVAISFLVLAMVGAGIRGI